MMVISATGPGDDPATPVSHKIDDQPSQHENGQPPPALAGASRRSSSSQSRVPSRPCQRCSSSSHPTPKALPSELPHRRCDRDRDHDALDIISIDTSSSSSRSPPPRRSPRKTKTQRGRVQPIAYVLVPFLPPGARTSDYIPVMQRSRTRQRQTAAKWKARAGDNLGSMELVYLLQVAFENNWPGAGSMGPSGKMTKKAAEEAVVVVDDEVTKREESDKFKIPTPFDQALAAAFAHNLTNPNAVSPRRKGRRHPRTPNSPRRKRRRMVDEQDHDDSDDSKIEIIVDAPRVQQRVSKSKPQSQPSARPQPRHKPRRSTQNRTSTPTAIHASISIHTSTPESTPPPQERSSPITPPDVNSLACLPLAILQEPAEIATPPRALSHLHSPPDPPDPLCKL
ncbi:hypothetical protein EDB89DRAFT_2124269 [Lactarius sanguifluus]|nr:hypothetical protein EDB89DRAFT_2124269 [Lactarius sanguifluus]